MTEFGFIVEGQLEKGFVQKVCKNRPVRVLGINGDNVNLDQIVRRAETLINLMVNKCDAILIIFDREAREKGHGEIARYVELELKNLTGEENIFVGVPDRDIESWIFADIDVPKNRLDSSLENQELGGDGHKSKGKMKKLFQNNSQSYKETIDGVDMLSRCRHTTMFENSPSYREFSEKVPRNCWWFTR
jgi:hypothetical protein